MRQIQNRFGLLIGTLLVSGALTCAAGLYGLATLDRALEETVGTDVPRLMTVTDLRRQIRVMVVAEGNYLLERGGGKAAKISGDLTKAARTIDSLFAQYERLVLPADRPDLAALRAQVTQWLALDARVQELARAGDFDQATALSRSHSTLWEDLIKRLIANADQNLTATTKATRASSASARTLVIVVFLSSALVGLIAGVLIYRAIRRMVSEVVQLKDRLVVINRGLEQTVEERTRTIRAILDHVSFGFFLVDADLKITEGYTRSLSRLLGREDLAGQPLTTCLGLTGDRAADFEINVQQVFDDLLPEALSCDQIPSRLVLHGRVLRIQASAVRDADGKVAQLLFGISDATDLEAAERSSRESQTLLRALKNPEPFRRFVADLGARFGSIRDALSAADEARARRELHTVKGNVSCYGFHELASRAHAIEEGPQIELPPIADLETEFSSFIQEHVDLLGIEPGSEPRETYRVEQGELDQLTKLLDATDDLPTLRRTLRAQLERLRWQPVGRLLGPIDVQVTGLAAQLGKVVDLQVANRDVRVLPASVQPVIAVLPHLLRNAIDHGVEQPAERGAKPTSATVQLAFHDTEAAWRVVVRDDGRGIDVDKLRAKAIAHGLLAEDATPNHAELCRLIFAAKLSTADEVTEISGRGEGMGAVADAVAQLGGQLHVRSTPGVGTTIEIEIPKPQLNLVAA